MTPKLLRHANHARDQPIATEFRIAAEFRDVPTAEVYERSARVGADPVRRMFAACPRCGPALLVARAKGNKSGKLGCGSRLHPIGPSPPYAPPELRDPFELEKAEGSSPETLFPTEPSCGLFR
jgi:hypothetical protein